MHDDVKAPSLRRDHDRWTLERLWRAPGLRLVGRVTSARFTTSYGTVVESGDALLHVPDSAASLWCMVVLNPIGFRCGYVLLPDGHPWKEEDVALEDVSARVHGGVNFLAEYPTDQLENGDGVPDGLWVGFDCGHAGDAPEPDRWRSATGGRDYPAFLSRIDHLWTTDEVAAECEALALQIAFTTPAAS